VDGYFQLQNPEPTGLELAAVQRANGNGDPRLPIFGIDKLAEFSQNAEIMKTTSLLLGNLMGRSPLRVVSLLILIVLACFAFSPGAQALPNRNSALEGVAKDPTGRPIKGADVRIEAKNFSKIAKTDARGHYISGGLVVGTYKVTLVVNGSVKVSIQNAKTQLGKATKLNFDLTATAATALATKHIHSVWCPNETGTLIGGNGRWIDVDDNGNIVSNTCVKSTTGFSSLERVSLQWEAHQDTLVALVVFIALGAFHYLVVTGSYYLTENRWVPVLGISAPSHAIVSDVKMP
jgi:carboxypeptidase family protein